MSLRDAIVRWIQLWLMCIIKSGTIPKHIGIIMDGNRRYAQQHNAANVIEGHVRGSDKFIEAFRFCNYLGVKEVTAYAFSIDNFKRTKEEVKGLMTLFEKRFQHFLDDRVRWMEIGVCVRVIGDLTLLPPSLRKIIAKVMLITKDNNKTILNVAIAYSGRDEIANAVKNVVSGAARGLLSTADVTQDLLPQVSYSRLSLVPDLVIRTSGEVRLSDFLLYQISTSCIYFTNVLWPDFTGWDLFWALLYYQRSYRTMTHVREHENGQRYNTEEKVGTSPVSSFVRHVCKKYDEYLSRAAQEEHDDGYLSQA